MNAMFDSRIDRSPTLAPIRDDSRRSQRSWYRSHHLVFSARSRSLGRRNAAVSWAESNRPRGIGIADRRPHPVTRPRDAAIRELLTAQQQIDVLVRETIARSSMARPVDAEPHCCRPGCAGAHRRPIIPRSRHVEEVARCSFFTCAPLGDLIW